MNVIVPGSVEASTLKLWRYSPFWHVAEMLESTSDD